MQNDMANSKRKGGRCEEDEKKAATNKDQEESEQGAHQNKKTKMTNVSGAEVGTEAVPKDKPNAEKKVKKATKIKELEKTKGDDEKLHKPEHAKASAKEKKRKPIVNGEKENAKAGASNDDERQEGNAAEADEKEVKAEEPKMKRPKKSSPFKTTARAAKRVTERQYAGQSQENEDDDPTRKELFPDERNDDERKEAGNGKDETGKKTRTKDKNMTEKKKKALASWFKHLIYIV